jgi:hypothetical protein
MSFRKETACCVATVLLLWPVAAQADFFGDVARTIGGVVSTGVQITTAPYETVINAAGAAVGLNQPADIFKPYANLGRAAGNTVAAATSVATAPSNFLYEQALRAASLCIAPDRLDSSEGVSRSIESRCYL